MTKYRYTFRWGKNERIELNNNQYEDYHPKADIIAIRAVFYNDLDYLTGDKYALMRYEDFYYGYKECMKKDMPYIAPDPNKHNNSDSISFLDQLLSDY